MSQNEVAVIGAGVSGLTAAYYLHNRGYDFTVFEKESRVRGQVYSKFIPNALPVADIGNGFLCGPDSPSELGAVTLFQSELTELADQLFVRHEPFGTETYSMNDYGEL